MSFIKSRLKRLEGGQRGCPECYRKPQTVHSFYPGKGEEPPAVATCESCARLLGVVLKVEYEGEG